MELDQLAIACKHSKDFVKPGYEAYLKKGDRKFYATKAVYKKRTRRYGCSKCDRHFQTVEMHLQSSIHDPFAYQCAGCKSQYASLSALLAHVEVSSCGEGITYGTGSIGQLLRHLYDYLAQ